MKLLLDENLPKRLKQDFSEFEIYTVRDKGWNGKKNGELMKLLMDEGFSSLITFDRNLQFQQNFSKYTLPVIVLNASDNTYKTLQAFVNKVKMVLKEELKPGPVIIE